MSNQKKKQYSDWWINGGALILAPNEVRTQIGNLRLVCTSGGFAPIHIGHMSCISESKKYGNFVAVIVNGDWFLTNKHGKPFQDLKTRCQIMSFVKGVDFVIPFEIGNDTTVCKALEIIKPDVFTKGGDRISPETIPEWDVCRANNITIQTGVGEPKLWSSSDFLKEWVKFKCS